MEKVLVHRLVNTCCYCRPRAGGDLSLMWHFEHAEHGSPPARGRHDKGSYLQEEILDIFDIKRAEHITAVALKSAQFAVGWALAQQQIQANNPKHVLLLSMACHF